MSLQLGKIHYWLYNKILWFQELEDEIIKLALENGVDIENIENEILNKHGTKIENKPLEEIIDISNIHGWLQKKISSSEKRMAAWSKVLINEDINAKDIYLIQGRKAGIEFKNLKGSAESPEEIYNAINDYILDGMPCDRINEIFFKDERRIEWNKRRCVHYDIWISEDVDVEYFYNLRKIWIQSFVNELNSDFEYIENDKIMKIVKK